MQLDEVRGSSPVAAYGTSRQRLKIDEASLLAIRAEMPTSNDDWEVQRIARYR